LSFDTAAGFVPGEVVFAPWANDGFLYPGVVVRADARATHLAFLDGDEADVPTGTLHRLAVTPGMKVSVDWKGKGRYFTGTVVSGVGVAFEMRYDDGDHGWTTIAQIRLPAR
jgi:hypothetical protein